MGISYRVDDREFVASITQEMRKFQELALDVLSEETKKVWGDDVMGTWDRPYRVKIQKKSSSRVIVSVSNTETTKNSSDDPRPPRENVPLYLNSGFSPRFAVLSSDWRSKTAPGRLKSTSGAGRVLRSGVAVNKAVAGQDFESLVAEEIESQLIKLIDKSWSAIWR